MSSYSYSPSFPLFPNGVNPSSYDMIAHNWTKLRSSSKTKLRKGARAWARSTTIWEAWLKELSHKSFSRSKESIIKKGTLVAQITKWIYNNNLLKMYKADSRGSFEVLKNIFNNALKMMKSYKNECLAFSVLKSIVMGRTPYYRTSNELKCVYLLVINLEHPIFCYVEWTSNLIGLSLDFLNLSSNWLEWHFFQHQKNSNVSIYW